jgi:hypothetical protein
MTTAGTSAGQGNSGGSQGSASGDGGAAASVSVGAEGVGAEAVSTSENQNDKAKSLSNKNKQSDVNKSLDNTEAKTESNDDAKAEVKAEAKPEANDEVKSDEAKEPAKEKSDYDSIKTEVESLRKYQVANREANKRIAQVINEHPEVAAIIRDLDKGATLREAIARHIDIEGLEAQEGDPDYEGWQKAKKERADKLKKQSEYESELDKNREFTQKEYNEFAKEYSLSDDEAKQFVETLQDMIYNVNSLKIDRKIMGMIRAALTKDKDVEAARKQGEIKAKNEKIVTERETQSNKEGDGLPIIGAGNKDDSGDMDTVLRNPLVRSIDKYVKRQRFN